MWPINASYQYKPGCNSSMPSYLSLSGAGTAAWHLQLHRIHTVFCPVWHKECFSCFTSRHMMWCCRDMLSSLWSMQTALPVQHSWHMVLAGCTIKAGAPMKKECLRPGQRTQCTAALPSVSNKLLVPDLPSRSIMPESICMCIHFGDAECSMLWRNGDLSKGCPEWSAAMLD